ncbi:MAG TPA: cytochrome c oxidase assembly protein [Candidatus Limnocylindrales bacterium]
MVVRHPVARVVVPVVTGLAAMFPSVAAAHGVVTEGPPTAATLVLGWSFEPAILIPLLAAALLWRWAVRRVDAAHPANRVPRARSAAFYGALAAIAVALASGIERYDTTLFSIHMVQHLLLTLVAAPLIVLSAPITLLLRLSSPATRQRRILPVLHSRAVRAVSFPVVAWFLFAAVMWGTHFSPLFDRALEDPLIHDLEHVAYLVAGVLFWWPAIGLDPSPWRMSHPVRVMYVFLQMPQNTFLAVAILNATQPLYPHYATLVRSWGPSPLIDQQIAAGIMWLFGDLGFLAAILGLVIAWMRHEERVTARDDRRADVEMAAIRERETALADRLAGERAAADRR